MKNKHWDLFGIPNSLNKKGQKQLILLPFCFSEHLFGVLFPLILLTTL